MYNSESYNIAFKYLQNKYGYVFLKYIDSVYSDILYQKVKTRKLYLATLTEAHKISTYDHAKIKDEVGLTIHLLLTQWVYGIDAKIELTEFLKHNNIS